MGSNNMQVSEKKSVPIGNRTHALANEKFWTASGGDHRGGISQAYPIDNNH